MSERLLQIGSRQVPAWVADGGRARAVVVLHELFGLVDDIRRITDRFAEAGYLAVAPDLYAGRGPGPLCILRVFRDLTRGEGVAHQDIDGVRRWVLEQGVGAGAIGVAGFCLGGGFAVLAAGRGQFAAAAPFYGEVPRDPARVPRLCPTVASFGERDRSFAGRAERLAAHLEAQGVPADVKVYEGVGHSFMSTQPWYARPIVGLPPMCVGYDESAAEDAWTRVLGFFDEHLVDPGG